MKFRPLFLLTSLFTLVNGFFFLFLPAFSLTLLGQGVSPALVMNTRIAGACGLSLSLLTGLAWRSRRVELLSAAAACSLAALLPLVLVDLQGVLSGAINWVGWLFFTGDLGLAAGFVLFFVRRPRP